MERCPTSSGDKGLNAAYCHLSQELLDSVPGLGGFNKSTRQHCDSSECLVCHYSTDCAYHTASVPGRLCNLLRKRSLSGAAAHVHFGSESDAEAGTQHDGPHVATQRADSSGGLWLQAEPSQLHDPCKTSSPSSGGGSTSAWQGWQYRPSYDNRSTPAPAQLVALASLGGPQLPLSQDMISALEFSPNGKLLATGSLAKQVSLYSLSELFAQQQQAQQQWGASSGQGRGNGWIHHSASTGSLSASCQQQRRVRSCIAQSPLASSTTFDPMSSGSPLARSGWWEQPQGTAPEEEEDVMDCDVTDDDSNGDTVCEFSISMQQGAAGGGAAGQQQQKRLWRARSASPQRGADADGSSIGSSTSYSCAPVAVHRLPSKVSCLAWSPVSDGVVTVGDYDGVITQLHICSGHQLGDVEAHSGRRIWGLSYSRTAPHLCASVSDDRTARIWAGACLDTCALVITPPQPTNGSAASSLCGVDWSPTHSHMLALASADHNVYLYDIRSARAPLHVLSHHARPVSYVRFFGANQLVSASTDASLAIWDLSTTQPTTPISATAPVPSSTPSPSEAACAHSTCCGSSSGLCKAAAAHQQQQPWKVLRGHRNEKNFVGLAVRPEDGLVACGSETSSVYTYHRSWDTPLAQYDVRRNSSDHSSNSSSMGIGPAPASKASAASSGGGSAASSTTCPQWESGTTASNSADSSGGTVTTWDAQQQQQQHSAAGPAHVCNPSSSPASHRARPGRPALFISAVSWQSAEASAALGLPALLAAGSSWGDVRLLMLAQPVVQTS